MFRECGALRPDKARRLNPGVDNKVATSLCALVTISADKRVSRRGARDTRDDAGRGLGRKGEIGAMDWLLIWTLLKCAPPRRDPHGGAGR